MSHRTYMSVSTVVFTLVALLHLCRVVWQWDATIAGWMVPMWVSWVGVVVAGVLAYSGYKHSSKR